MNTPGRIKYNGSVMLISVMQPSAGIYLLKSLLESEGVENFHFIIGDIRFYSIIKSRITPREIDILTDRIKKIRPRIIAFSITSTDAILTLGTINQKIKEVSDAYTICGGAGATILPEKAIECVDGVCIGEGIYPFREFVDAVFNGKRYENIKNFWFRKGGKIIKNPTRPLMDINEYPRLSFEGYYYHISDGVIEKKKEPAVPLMFCSLGCPMNCSYCTVSYLRTVQEGPCIRIKKVSRIIEELQYYKSKGIKYVSFWDASFPINDEKFIEEFSREYKKNIRLPFFCFTNPNLIREPSIIKLKECGLKHLGIGIQSYSERVRKIYRRTETNKQIIKISRLLEKYKIRATYDLIIGPLDSFRDHLEYIKIIPKIKGRFILSMHNYILLPKTELAEYLIKNKIVDQNYSLDYDTEYFNKPKGVFRFIQFLYIFIYFLSHPAFLFDKFTLRTFIATQDSIARFYYLIKYFIKRKENKKRGYIYNIMFSLGKKLFGEKWI